MLIVFGKECSYAAATQILTKLSGHLPVAVTARSKAWVGGARWLGLRVRIPPGAWMPVCCECCVFSGRGLCVGLITRTEESFWVWCVLSVTVKPPEWGDSGSLGVVVPYKGKNKVDTCQILPVPQGVRRSVSLHCARRWGRCRVIEAGYL
jgi:hypothetical protein